MALVKNVIIIVNCNQAHRGFETINNMSLN